MRAQYLLETYYGERLFLSAETSQSLELCYESEEHVDQLYNQSIHANDLMQMIENHEIKERNGPLNFRQLRVIRDLGIRLKRTAINMQIRPTSCLLAVERAILLNEGLSDVEMKVIKLIHSESTSTTIPRIAEHLVKCLTSRTLRAVLRYLCYSASSVLEELAATCELVKVIYPRIQQAVQAGSIYDELREFIENKLDDVLH